jgi:cytochrome c
MSSRIFLGLATAAAVTFGTASAFAAGDADSGEKVFNKCKACHTVEKDGKHRVGPNLHGIFGKAAGTMEGFGKYSKGIQELGITWDEATMDKYLTNPKAMVKGSRMAFPGLKKEEDRADVIAYLKKVTQ